MRPKTRRKAKRRRMWSIALSAIVAVTVGGWLCYTRHLAPAKTTKEPALQTTARKGNIVITAVGGGAERRDILLDTVIELLGQRAEE